MYGFCEPGFQSALTTGDATVPAAWGGAVFMSRRRFVVFEICLLLLVAMLANAASRSNDIRITVLDSETHTVSVSGGDVPKNCDGVNFDAYCNNSKTTRVTNTLLVQAGNDPPFRVTCNIDSKWSKCVPLPKGESFDARREKHGVVVYYIDDKGKARSQLYTFVDTGGKTSPPATATAPQGSAAAAPVTQTAAPAHNSPPPAPAPLPAPAQGSLLEKSLSEKVRCNFSSTPSGAEISVDWRYVGNTPSEIGLSPGTHVVVISLPGFAEWKRELTVGADSAVNVTANLQKTQP